MRHATMRAQNVFGNRHNPSKDIATSFSVLENLRFVCEGGHHQNSKYNELLYC